ncbi:flagellar hook protein FlgE, partial [Methylobacterium trifolii]|uniref:flagellar hook protein FlgE n=1 Tax=Methylobacterium trifolii TaxID=1003092 RepID=UPI001EDD81AC
SALQTAVSGLKAQSYAIGNISGNIANSQTTGYRRIDTSFVDLIAEQTPRREVAGTVLAQAQLTNTIAGNITGTKVPTNMAISGDGFFVVQRRTGDANGQSAFSSTNLYTRRGDFSLDKDGYLVNGAGGYLQGQNIDAATGQAGSTGAIRIGNTTLPAKKTTSITYAANLPATPTTTASATSKSSLYAPTGGAGLVMSGTATPPPKIAAADASTFVANSISGPTLTAYTESGAPVTVTTRWAKLQDAKAADPAATPPTVAQDAVWNLFYAADPSVAADKTSWTNAGSAFTFDNAGQLKTPASGSAVISGLTVGGTTVGDVSFDFGKTGLTQYAAASGAVTTNAQSQNGYAAGTLNDISVTAEGQVVGSFSNGSVMALANVGIARFVNPDGLKPDSNGNYEQTVDSGTPLSGLNGGSLIGASIEQSNTDIADEFSKMIVTQQAYSANTKVMSTAQQMMSDLLNVIR